MGCSQSGASSSWYFSMLPMQVFQPGHALARLNLPGEDVVRSGTVDAFFLVHIDPCAMGQADDARA